MILMLSADRHLVDAGRCRELGVNTILTKPLSQSELLDAILSLLGAPAVEQHLVKNLPPQEDKPKSRSLNILLAEDNPVNQKLAMTLLKKAGHTVTLAENGKQVLDALDHVTPPGFDIVLMDIQMPEMTGTEATVAIREREKSTGDHLPIMAMTANAMRGDKENYFEAGMDGYVSKPIHPARMFAEIERCLAGSERSMPMEENSVQQGESIDRVALLERVEGDQELLGEMIQLFLGDVPQLLDAMRKALQQGDMVLLERSAHSMKGAAGNLSAQVTQNAALQLEQSAKKGDAELSKKNLTALEGAVERLIPLLENFTLEVSK
jgi:CheY-like chemotaxis protein